MALTGFPDGPPVASPAAGLAVLERVARELATATRTTGQEVRADPAELIAGRAAITGLTRQGRVSAGGSTRLLRSADGWCAVTLSREADVAALPALLGVLGSGRVPAAEDPWTALASAALARPAHEVAGAAQLLGIPASALPREYPQARWPPWRTTRIAAPILPAPPASSGAARLDGAVVADLSAMWAGPLCARLLGLAGARVIKVESADRPDGARSGDQRFYDWLHAGHRSIALPFGTVEGRAALSALLASADIVIEASRPRALAGLGVAPEMIAHKPGQVWLSITGHGRDEPDLVAFGDDAAVAGGLVGWTGRHWGQGEPVFCADAIADPLTGACGALAVARSLAAGGGELIDLPMRAVAANFAAASLPAHGAHEIAPDGTVWCAALGRAQRVLPPRTPATAPRAARLGADTEAVLAWLGAARG